VKRSGTADLPLHGGHVPPWLANRMTELGTAISEHILLEYGASEFLTRLSDPFWFQAFGAVMGMDWHSSGITTSVMGALKRGLNPGFDELGLMVCGGRGHPFPVPLKTYDESLAVLRRSLESARVGHLEKLHGFERLDRLTRHVEQEQDPLANFDAALKHEWQISPSVGGRTVLDDRRRPRHNPDPFQRSLF